MKITADVNTEGWVVAYHSGGMLWAGDTEDHPEGWYLYTGEDTIPVIVYAPDSNEPLKVE